MTSSLLRWPSLSPLRGGSAILILCGLMGSPMAVHALECKVVCAQGETLCKLSGDTAPVQRSRHLPDCQQPDLRVEAGCIDIWYTSRHTPTKARACQGQSVAAALKAPDEGCTFLGCLVPSAPTAVAGAHPVGMNAESNASSGARAGLPFDVILPPAGALQLSLVPHAPGASGSFTLQDEGTRVRVVTVPISNGAATVPAGVIEPERTYTYRWQTAEGTLEGRFLTASYGAVVAQHPSATSGATQHESSQWEQIRLMALKGYRWDAMQAARRLMGTEEAR